MDETSLDELRISSDICEEAGFVDEAKFLQSLSDRTCRVYVVVERGFEYNDEIYGLNKEVEPQQVFFDKTSALRMAEAKNVEQLRQYSPLAFCYDVSEISSLGEAEIQARLREILNDPSFQLSSADHWGLDPIFPDYASDEQMREICRLFDNLHLFEVIESELSV